MKKVVFAISIVLLIIVGCETKYYSVLITNDSGKTVSYIYNDISDTLASKTSKTYEVLAYTQLPKNINVPNGALSVKMNQKGDTFTFVDVEPLNLNVVNKLPIEIKIRADSYIDDNGATEFTIDANAEKTTGKIYTSKPVFRSLTDYPVIIDWYFNDNTVYVIIR
jgi:hypothetical protein